MLDATVQARRQDSVTGGAEINFGGHEQFIYVNSREARELCWSVDETKMVKTNKKGLQYNYFCKF